MSEDKTKEFNFSIAPAITALLKPIAETAGDEISKSIRLFAEKKRKEKRKENIREHILALKLIINENPPQFDDTNNLSCLQLSLLEEWTEHAQDVSGEEEVLARMWQKILADILYGKTHIKYLIDQLKKLSSAEAELLVKLGAGSTTAENEADLFLLKEMQEKKIVKKSYSSEIISLLIPIFFIVILFFIISSISTLEMKGSVLAYDSVVSMIMLAGSIIFANMIFIGFYLFKLLKKTYYGVGAGKWSLGWIGRELVKYSVKADNDEN